METINYMNIPKNEQEAIFKKDREKTKLNMELKMEKENDPPACSTDEICSNVNEMLNSFAPFNMETAHELSYKNLDISDVEEKYKDCLKYIFEQIAVEIDKGGFEISILFTDLSIGTDFRSLKIKKYLESIRYNVFICQPRSSNDPAIIINWL